MIYDTLLAKAPALLQQEQRLSYQAFKPRLQLDDDTLDVHFVSPAPVSSPGSAGLQPGSGSHAGAWRSQGKPRKTGSGFMKQTSSPRKDVFGKDMDETLCPWWIRPIRLATAIDGLG